MNNWIHSRYSEVVLPDGETIHLRDKNSAFKSIREFPDKYIKLPKWSCILNCCSEGPGVSVTDAEMNHYKDM